MRDSINYNLNYFIMRMSGTKPMKNTMRKSPIKQEVATKTYVTSTNNNRAGIAIRGKKTSSYVAINKEKELKNNKPASAETTAKRAADKKTMDTYIKVHKSKQALKNVKK